MMNNNIITDTIPHITLVHISTMIIIPYKLVVSKLCDNINICTVNIFKKIKECGVKYRYNITIQLQNVKNIKFKFFLIFVTGKIRLITHKKKAFRVLLFLFKFTVTCSFSYYISIQWLKLFIFHYCTCVCNIQSCLISQFNVKWFV